VIRKTITVLVLLLSLLLSFSPALAARPEDLIRDTGEVALSAADRAFLSSLPTLRVVMDDDYTPLSYYDAGSRTYLGIAPELFAHLADKLGISWEPVGVPGTTWEEKTSQFYSGQADLMLPVSITEERMDTGVFSEAFYQSYYSVIGKTGQEAVVASPEDLAGYRVGAVRNSAGATWLEENLPEDSRVLVNTQQDLYADLRQGRLDFGLQNQDVFLEDRFRLEMFDLTGHFVLAGYPRRYGFYLGETPELSRLSGLLDRAMETVEYSALIAHYRTAEDALLRRYLEQRAARGRLGFLLAAASLTAAALAWMAFRSRRMNRKLSGVLRQLEEGRRRFDQLAFQSRTLLWEVDLQGVYTYLGDSLQEILGYRPEDLIGKKAVWDLHPAEGREEFRQEAIRIMGDGEDFTGLENPMETADGTVLWFLSAGVPRRDQEGRILGYRGWDTDITERREAEMLLLISGEKYRLLVEHATDMFWSLSPEGQVLYVSPSWERVTGHRSSVAETRNVESFLHPEDRKIMRGLIRQVLESGRGIERAGYRVLHADGLYYDHLAGISPVKDEDGRVTGLVGISRDITDMKQAQEALQESEAKFRSLFETMQEGVGLYREEDGQYLVTDVNPAFARILEREPRELLGKSVRDLLGREPQSLSEESQEILHEGLNKFLRISAVSPRPGKLATVLEDVTSRRAAEDRVWYLSFHDALTGLYNRRFFEAEQKRLDTPRNLPMGLVMADVNGLKLANDAFGHRTGDRILTEAARLLQEECRADDILARVGGDEFVILLPRTSGSEVAALVERIRKAVNGTLVDSISLSVSFGWAVKESPEQSMEEIYKRAEDGLYHRKLDESPRMRDSTIRVIRDTLFDKIPSERLHAQRVAESAGRLAEALGLPAHEVEEIRLAGRMHDIGKIALPEALFEKEIPWNGEDYLEARRHAESGYQILRSVSAMTSIAEAVLAHHENWDGSGYPRGLAGSDIPLAARILRLADTFDVMTSDRTYMPSLSHGQALEELKQLSGQWFDPDMVQVFLEEVLKVNKEEFPS